MGFGEAGGCAVIGAGVVGWGVTLGGIALAFGGFLGAIEVLSENDVVAGPSRRRRSGG